ncbi:hypothetical protein EY920_04955 [Citrobacter braakii]|nr:hypothetical protein EY920_04955 [Citrobacter braakii]
MNAQGRLTAGKSSLRDSFVLSPHRFSAGPGSSLQRTDFQLNLFCCSDKKRRRSGVGWSG